MDGLEPEAFSMMDLEEALVRDGRLGGWSEGRGVYLSMKAIRGDIKPAAHEALMASAPRRMPRFLVFHWRAFELVCVGGVVAIVVEDGDDGVAASADGAMALQFRLLFYVSARYSGYIINVGWRECRRRYGSIGRSSTSELRRIPGGWCFVG